MCKLGIINYAPYVMPRVPDYYLAGWRDTADSRSGEEDEFDQEREAHQYILDHLADRADDLPELAFEFEEFIERLLALGANDFDEVGPDGVRYYVETEYRYMNEAEREDDYYGV